MTKVCRKCGSPKGADEFPRLRSSKDGIKNVCLVCDRATQAAYRERNRERMREYHREWYAKNIDVLVERKARWRAANADKHRALVRASNRKRRLDPTLRLSMNLGSYIGAFIGSKKSKRTAELLGYSGAELKAHLERQFLPKMSWDNYGEWHIDHIVPVSAFRGGGEGVVRKAWALPNLRPMWAVENLRKGAKRLYLV